MSDTMDFEKIWQSSDPFPPSPRCYPLIECVAEQSCPPPLDLIAIIDNIDPHLVGIQPPFLEECPPEEPQHENPYVSKEGQNPPCKYVCPAWIGIPCSKVIKPGRTQLDTAIYSSKCLYPAEDYFYRRLNAKYLTSDNVIFPYQESYRVFSIDFHAPGKNNGLPKLQDILENKRAIRYSVEVPTALNTGDPIITCVINWPGYSRWMENITVIDGRRRRSSGQIVLDVAKIYKRFFEYTSTIDVHDVLKEDGLPLGGNGVSFDRLYISHLVGNSDKSQWEAVIYIE